MAKAGAFCTKCGTPLAPRAQFCAGCGLNVVEEEVQRHALQTAREQRRIIDEKRLIGIAVVVVLLLIYFFVK